MWIIKHKWIFLSFSILLVVVALGLIIGKGVKKSIEFTGGTETVIAYQSPSSIDLSAIEQSFEKNGFEVKDLAFSGEKVDNTQKVDITLLGEISTENRELFTKSWQQALTNATATQISETVIGPSMGRELAKKAFWAIGLVIIVIIIFVAYSFRKVSEPVPSWKYGMITIWALLHDITIPLGLYVVLGMTHGVEVDSLFVLALLTIMGLSMADTIVVFDRVRENLERDGGRKTFAEIVGESLDETIFRSFATGVAILLVLFALFFYGPSSIHYFTLTLIVGMSIGIYSSIFVASPILTLVEKWQTKHQARKEKKAK